MTSTDRSAPAAPSLMLMGIEPLRAAFEYAGMKLMDRQSLPKGDGHAVVLFPGLASDRRATVPLKDFCESLGYVVLDWGRGFNTGPEGELDAWFDALAQDIERLTQPHGQRISLVGWSLGGIYAREVGKRLPKRVRQVITLGTPFAGGADSTNAAFVYRLLNGKSPPIDQALSARLRVPPKVPTTSVYSRSDGIVAWEACLHDGDHVQSENVEVDGSHCGLGWNSKVYAVIADRLGQREGHWQPYAAPTATCA